MVNVDFSSDHHAVLEVSDKIAHSMPLAISRVRGPVYSGRWSVSWPRQDWSAG